MQEILRSQVLKENTWNTDVLYENDDNWSKEYTICEKRIHEVEKFKGNLKSAEIILDCFKLRDELSLMLSRLYVYANLKLHEDNNDTHYQGLSNKATNLSVRFSENFSFISSELLEIDETTIKDYLNSNKELAEYRHYFDELFREKEHILSPEMEALLANAHEMGEAADEIFSMLNEADLTFGTVNDENGKEVVLTHGRYASLMESKNAEVRKNTFKTFYKPYIAHKNTFAATFSSNLKKDLFFAKARKYNSTLEHALSSDNIPVKLYKNLINVAHSFLPDMHKYITIRKERLNLKEIHMYDLYTPIILEADTTISYEKAKEHVLESLKPLGEEYVNKVKDGFNNRWIDVYENKGKRSGAYSWGVYGANPFIFLNYDNKVNDMFTLTHEMGHAMHSYYSWDTQKYFFSDYSIFVAEVASTVNEALLMEHLLKTTTDDIFKQYLLNYFIEQFRTTFFRQTMFAEFEMITHEMVQNNNPLTSESLSEIYRELNRKYYGPDIILDEEIDMEWSRIPHFYSSFYVYKYATGYSAAIALSKKILTEQDGAKKYIEFLKSGSSDYPINVLKKAGVDMSSDEPIKSSLLVFKDLINKI